MSFVSLVFFLQSCSLAFGERLVSERMLLLRTETETPLRGILEQLHHLYLVDSVQANLGWFIAHNLLLPNDGKNVNFCSSLIVNPNLL